MHIHQIVLEQERITSPQQMRQAFSADEWQKIECSITKNYINSRPQGLTGTGESQTRRIFQRIHNQLGAQMPNRYTPAEWMTYARTFLVPITITNPSWSEIKDFLATLITNDPLLPGCDYETATPTGGTANPNTPESKADILRIMSDGPAQFETYDQMREYMQLFLTRMGETDSRNDQDSRMLTWLDRVLINNGNNQIMQYYARVATNFATQNDGEWVLENTVNKRALDDKLWEWLLIADRLVQAGRSRDATAGE